VLLAVVGLKGLLALAPSGMPRRADISIDLVVVGFTLTLGIIVGIAMALAPLAQSVRVDISGAIGERGGTARGSRLRGALVVAQVALSLMLLAGTGLLLTSFGKLMKVDGGFDADGVVLLSYTTPNGKYTGSERARYHQRVIDRLRAVPGVVSIGLTTAPPLLANANQSEAGFPESPTNTGDVHHDRIMIDVMGIPLIEGRDFTAGDDSAHGPVAIIDEQLAKHYFPSGTAIGRRIRLTGVPVDVRVVGVVPTVHQYGLRDAGRPQVYAPDAVVPNRSVTTVMKTHGDEASLMRAARAAFHELDPGQPIEQLTTMRAVVNQSLGETRLVLVIISTFAVTALLLAAIGIYGVTSTAVMARSREMGVRIALGAQPREVLTLIFRRPTGLILTGTILGFVGTWFSRELMLKLLYGVSPTDPIILFAVVGTLLVVAFLSVYAPASRAARLDAARVLRAD
jgi:predicted permease